MKQEVELCYAWQETEEGVYHAFEVVDTEEKVDFDAVSEKLAELLDTTTDDQRFDWNSMRVSLPESVVKRIASIPKPDSIERALADWRGELDHIIDKLGTPELLTQLAEEAAELGKAALKFRRALDGKNPTPISPADALLNLQEKMADVLLVMAAIGLDQTSAERTIRAKIPRWVGRIDRDEDSDCLSGFTDEVGGYHEGGCGWDPNGHFCGECSDASCADCPVWRRPAVSMSGEGGGNNGV